MLREGVTEETAVFRLSPQQEQLWRAEASGSSRRVRCVVDLPESDPAAVIGALQRAVNRHEILRTTFVRRSGMKLPGQAIHDQLEPTLVDDLGSDPGADAVVAAHFTSGPNGGSRLTLTLSAPCGDLRSSALLAAELRADLAGSPPDGEPLQYADYTEWRLETIAGQPSEADDLLRSPSLPFVRAEAVTADHLPVPIAVQFDAGAVARSAEACGVAPAVFLEACWHACVARVSGDGVVSVAHVLDGRTQQELEDAIGPYAQALPLTTTVDETTSIAEVADRVRRERTRLEQHQDNADGEALARAAGTCRLGFSHVRYPRGAGIHELLGAPAPFLANLCLLDDGDEARLELQVAPALVESGTAGLLSATLTAIVGAAGRDVTTPVADLAVRTPDLSSAEQSAFAGADEPRTTSTVTELFDAVVARAADVAAVVAHDGTLTYRELDERATQLAARLLEHGVGPDTAVALCFERSANSIVALLGVLKAGGAYLPLNFEHPAARLAHQLSEAKTRLLLTETSVSDRLPALDCPVLVVDDAAAVAAEQPPPVNTADDLVYVMYTSGSSGAPKGVGVTHGNLAAYATSILHRLGLGDTTGVSFAAVSALSTDLGNTSIFAALLGGGTLHLVSPADALDGQRFAAYLQAHPVDVLKITPSHLRALLSATEPVSVLPRRLLVLGGEALTWEFVDRVRETGSPCRILNHYGPTETTIGVCTFEPEAALPQGSTVPVGRPLPRSRVYVVDRALQLLPIGIPGELLIGGDGVARGYLGDPAQTAERFLPDPFAAADGARVYRTGDRVRALRDGTIEFLGRVDDQVKIHGYRVEPSEVQAVLATHPAVRQCAVVARAAGDDHELVAYVVSSGPVSAEDAKTFLRESLPAHMIPARVVELEALPLTASGKIDRRALPDPGLVEGGAGEYVAPRTPLEEELARIWQELLGVERVGIHDDFFSLGGHSLLATQAVIRIRRSIGDVPLHSLLNAPTVSALAEAIVDAELEAEAAAGDAV